ncbi:MAG: hypothetical protein P4L40_19120 [Terracidiphilus sp.]|nr:hypothetical protein [Terracidiphilus sp.]
MCVCTCLSQNRQGQLGHSNPSPGHPAPVEALDGVRIVSVSSGRQHTVAVDDSGAVYAWGDGKSGATGTGFKEFVPSPRKVR